MPRVHEMESVLERCWQCRKEKWRLLENASDIWKKPFDAMPRTRSNLHIAASIYATSFSVESVEGDRGETAACEGRFGGRTAQTLTYRKRPSTKRQKSAVREVLNVIYVVLTGKHRLLLRLVSSHMSPSVLPIPPFIRLNGLMRVFRSRRRSSVWTR